MTELTTLAHELRMIADDDGDWVAGPISADMLREAADTIEGLRKQVAKCQIAELKADYDTSRHFELFGTPERAARTWIDYCGGFMRCADCPCCHDEHGFTCELPPKICAWVDEGHGYDALLEWLEGDA